MKHPSYTRSVAVLLAALITVAVVVAVANARSTGGGYTVGGAPLIPLNTTIQGDLPGNPDFNGVLCEYCDFQAEYYKVNFTAGDRVLVRSISAGDTAPCVEIYPPGTDDYNLPDQRAVNYADVRNTNHYQLNFTAGTTGPFVFVMYDDNDSGSNDCGGSSQWAYSFVVEAPHMVRLAFASSAKLHTGVNHVSVSVRDALNVPIKSTNLTIGLATQWPGTKAKQVARANVRNGIASFTFSIPKSRAGSRVIVIVGAGDNINWVAVTAHRTYRIE